MLHFGALSSSTSPVLAFASGSNAVGEVRGFAELGVPVGVSAPDCREPCIQALLRLAGTGLAVFVDNGAISEFKTKTVITDAQWAARLALYLRLAQALRSQLYVVAPDCIGDPAETKARWARTASKLAAIQATGAHILVPLQAGQGTTLRRMHDAADAILRFPFIPAIPSRAGVTPIGDIESWFQARRPKAVHFLGVGPETKDGRALLTLVRRYSSGCSVSMDSVRLRAHVGHTGGPGGGARRFTAALATAKEQLQAHWFGEPPPGAEDAEGMPFEDYTDSIVMEVNSWLTGRARLLFSTHFPPHLQARFLADPFTVLTSSMHGDEEPEGTTWGEYLDPELDRAWAAYRAARDVHEAKRRAVVATFQGRS